MRINYQYRPRTAVSFWCHFLSAGTHPPFPPPQLSLFKKENKGKPHGAGEGELLPLKISLIEKTEEESHLLEAPSSSVDPSVNNTLGSPCLVSPQSSWYFHPSCEYCQVVHYCQSALCSRKLSHHEGSHILEDFALWATQNEWLMLPFLLMDVYNTINS